MVDVINSLALLIQCVAALEAVMIINIICGLVGGILIPMYTYGKFAKYVKVDEEIQDGVEIEEIASPILTGFKIVPIIAALILVGKIVQMAKTLESQSCSDSQTNASFQGMGKALFASYNSSIGNIVMECLLVVYGTYFLWNKNRKAKKLLKSTQTDTFGRMVCAVEIPKASSMGKSISIEAFCASYTAEIGDSVAVGTTVYLYKDGEVWSNLQDRDNTYNGRRLAEGMGPRVGFLQGFQTINYSRVIPAPMFAMQQQFGNPPQFFVHPNQPVESWMSCLFVISNY